MEITIDGQTAELGSSMPSITKRSVDINNPSARFVDSTNRFVMPDTVRNRTIFQSPHAVGSNNRSYEKLYNCVLNDVFQIFKGKGFLDSGSRDKFNFQLVDESKELFKALDTQLKNISWDDKDTILTTAAIDALDAADPTTCWFWGKACYHSAAFIGNTDQTTGDSRTKYSRPAFYVTGLLKRAVEQAGYDFTVPDIDLAISSNHKQFFFTSYQKTFNATFNPAGSLTVTGLNTYDFKHADVTATSTEVTMLHRTILRFRGHVTTNADIIFGVHAHDGPHTKEIVNEFLLPRDGYIDFSTSEIYDTPAGMIAYLYFTGTGVVTFTDVLMYTNLSEDYEDLSANHWLGFKIKAHDNLPEFTYLDLYRLICVVSNSYHSISGKVFGWDTFANLNKMNSVDWSDKFIIGSEQVNANFPGLFQKNWLKYSNDETVKFDLGWSYFESDRESLEAEGDYLVLNFGASKETNIDGDNIAYVPIYSDETRIADQEISPRLFIIDGSRLLFQPLSWDELIETYYENWFNSLYRIRAIQADFNLNKLDVLKWYPKQLVYIDYFKTTFIVLEISNFIAGIKTKVKLLAYGR
jgi:hypothetical protein